MVRVLACSCFSFSLRGNRFPGQADDHIGQGKPDGGSEEIDQGMDHRDADAADRLTQESKTKEMIQEIEDEHEGDRSQQCYSNRDEAVWQDVFPCNSLFIWLFCRYASLLPQFGQSATQFASVNGPGSN